MSILPNVRLHFSSYCISPTTTITATTVLCISRFAGADLGELDGFARKHTGATAEQQQSFGRSECSGCNKDATKMQKRNWAEWKLGCRKGVENPYTRDRLAKHCFWTYIHTYIITRPEQLDTRTRRRSRAYPQGGYEAIIVGYTISE